jgi:hypothetical protein
MSIIRIVGVLTVGRVPQSQGQWVMLHPLEALDPARAGVSTSAPLSRIALGAAVGLGWYVPITNTNTSRKNFFLVPTTLQSTIPHFLMIQLLICTLGTSPNQQRVLECFWIIWLVRRRFPAVTRCSVRLTPHERKCGWTRSVQIPSATEEFQGNWGPGSNPVHKCC